MDPHIINLALENYQQSYLKVEHLNEDIMALFRSERVKQYIIDHSKDQLLLFNYSGVFISSSLTVSQLKAFIAILCYVIFLGKRIDDDS